MGLIPGSGRSPGGLHGNPFQYSCLETRGQSLGWEETLEEGMATHSSILTWRIPQTQEPGGLWSIGLQRVRQD